MRSLRLDFDNNYELYEDGRIYSHKTKKFLKIGFYSKTGYPYYTLSVKGKFKPYTIHRLLAHYFLRPLQKGDVICHLDNNEKNYNLSNLIIADQKTNMSHKKIHGTEQNGTRHGMAKLTDIEVAIIKKAKGSEREIAEDFGIAKSTVNFIKSGRHWKHLDFNLLEMQPIEVTQFRKLNYKKIKEGNCLGCFEIWSNVIPRAKYPKRYGEKSPRCKLSSDQIKFIRENFKMIHKQKSNANELAAIFGINTEYCRTIARGINRRHD